MTESPGTAGAVTAFGFAGFGVLTGAGDSAGPTGSLTAGVGGRSGMVEGRTGAGPVKR